MTRNRPAARWRRAIGAALLAALFAAPAAQGQDARDRTVVAGKRVGPITAATAPADLPRLFGAGAVAAAKVGGEGEEYDGATVHAGTADALEIAYAEGGRRIRYVRILGANWATAAGLKVGAGLADLERINGGPVQLNGFGWELGGIVLEDPANAIALPGLRVVLDIPSGPAPADARQIEGQIVLRSDHAVLRRVGARVVLLEVRFDP